LPANAAYRAARGEVLVCQQGDVLHTTQDSIERLVEGAGPGRAVIAEVWDYDPATGRRGRNYTGPKRRRPFFFLGSVLRADLYAVGGYDEDFCGAGFEDNWLAMCLERGAGVQ